MRNIEAFLCSFLVAKESIEALKIREIDLNQRNKQLIIEIEKKEKDSIHEVDGILRKYEKYQVNSCRFYLPEIFASFVCNFALNKILKITKS
jgi:hypothetical protein